MKSKFQPYAGVHDGEQELQFQLRVSSSRELPPIRAYKSILTPKEPMHETRTARVLVAAGTRSDTCMHTCAHDGMASFVQRTWTISFFGRR
jgi:hypothetical protein